MRFAMLSIQLISFVLFSIILLGKTPIKIYYPLRSYFMIGALGIDVIRLIIRLLYTL